MVSPHIGKRFTFFFSLAVSTTDANDAAAAAAAAAADSNDAAKADTTQFTAAFDSDKTGMFWFSRSTMHPCGCVPFMCIL